MIKYQQAIIELATGPRFVSLPGDRTGLRVVSARIVEEEVILDLLVPDAPDKKLFYHASGNAESFGYTKRTLIYVEVVDLGELVKELDACDFITVVEHDGVRKAIFASVRA